MFCCPEPGCVKEYIKLGNLEKHIASEKHIYKEASEPLGDHINGKWAEQFEKKGWALNTSKKVAWFPEKVKNYLKEKFEAGNATGHKEDPVQVSVDMKCARDELGQRMFSAGGCPKPQQIRSSLDYQLQKKLV